MAKDQSGSVTGKWVWLLVLAAVVAVAAFFMLGRPAGDAPGESVRQTVPSGDFTTRPEGGVEVDLPDTPMTNAPREQAGDTAPEPAEDTAE